MRLLRPSFAIEAGVFGREVLEQIERAARTCYKSEPAGDPAKFVKQRLIKTWQHPLYERHDSTIEHVGFTVRFIIDRGVSHELVRHRIAAFSQESTRYVDYAGDKTDGHCQFIIPPWLPEIPEGIASSKRDGERSASVLHLGDTEAARPAIEVASPTGYRWLLALDSAEHDYQALRGEGWTPQQARSVLPNSTKTEVVMTASYREWRHVFVMRALNPGAHPQMREIMLPLLQTMKERTPVLFDDLEPLR